MPEVRPFRALRYDAEVVPELATVVAPPYDVIGPARRAELAGRDERNVVAVEVPDGNDSEAPEDRYRRAARTLAAWRSAGVLRKDRRPSWYPYEQSYVAPGSNERRIQRGYFGLVRLVPFGPDGGILAHERTLDAPREDRYRLLRATGTNISPVVGLYEDRAGRSGPTLAAMAGGPPTSEVTDDDGTIHRLWTIDADEPTAADLADQARVGPIVIADGHHRYETALRYRDERHMTRSCDEDPPFDWVLMLLLATDEPLTILPTHRLIAGLDGDAIERLPDQATELFGVEAVSQDALAAGIPAGKIGLATASGGWLLTPTPVSLGAEAANGRAVDRLDVAVLGVALARIWGIDASDVAGGRLAYTTSTTVALDAVASGQAGAAFLVAPTPVDAVLEVAREGDVMPQKSTHFYPKALTGLVLNPHEW